MSQDSLVHPNLRQSVSIQSAEWLRTATTSTSPRWVPSLGRWGHTLNFAKRSRVDFFRRERISLGGFLRDKMPDVHSWDSWWESLVEPSGLNRSSQVRGRDESEFRIDKEQQPRLLIRHDKVAISTRKKKQTTMQNTLHWTAQKHGRVSKGVRRTMAREELMFQERIWEEKGSVKIPDNVISLAFYTSISDPELSNFHPFRSRHQPGALAHRWAVPIAASVASRSRQGQNHFCHRFTHSLERCPNGQQVICLHGKIVSWMLSLVHDNGEIDSSDGRRRTRLHHVLKFPGRTKPHWSISGPNNNSRSSEMTLLWT